MESALYGIYALVVFVSEISLVRCAHSFDFWHKNNSCVNNVRQHFPRSILYLCKYETDYSTPWIMSDSLVSTKLLQKRSAFKESFVSKVSMTLIMKP